MPTLLLAEDNELNRDFLSRRLRRAGFDVIIASDGHEALNMAREGHPDLVLMDLSLPGIDGWEVARSLKADANTRGIPIIALTAHVMVSDREGALLAGCDDYASKPIEFQQLIGKIQAMLARSAGEQPHS